MRSGKFISVFVLAPAVAFASVSAFAGVSYDEAQVVRSEPIIETVSYTVPKETCQDEEVAYREYAGRRSATGPILGAIIGGAIGNALGHHKRNRQVGTVVGAVLGGSIGADISRNRSPRSGDVVRYRTERVCQVVNEYREEEQIAGYRVTYEYGGETYTTRMSQAPGRTIPVRVRVTPAG